MPRMLLGRRVSSRRDRACESASPELPDPQLSLFEGEDFSAADRLALTRAVPNHVRRLIPARDDLRPLYITGHGLVVGKTGEVLQIRKRLPGNGDEPLATPRTDL